MKAAKYLLLTISMVLISTLAHAEVPVDLPRSFYELNHSQGVYVASTFTLGHCDDGTYSELRGTVISCEKACSLLSELSAIREDESGAYFQRAQNDTYEGEGFHALVVDPQFHSDASGPELAYALHPQGGWLFQFEIAKDYFEARSGNGPLDLSRGKNDLGLSPKQRIKDYCYGNKGRSDEEEDAQAWIDVLVEEKNPADEDDEGAYAWVDVPAVEELPVIVNPGVETPLEEESIEANPAAVSGPTGLFIQGSSCTLNSATMKSPIISSILFLFGAMILGLRRRRNVTPF